MSESTKVLFCGCSHSFQDGRYGEHMRLHNWAHKAESWRCTVCKTEKRKQPVKKDDKNG